jgi:zinc transport system substrate-binding protein
MPATWYEPSSYAEERGQVFIKTSMEERRSTKAAVTAVLLAFGACAFPSSATSAFAGEKLTVYVVNYPLQYFAERIGGKHVEVAFPAPGGVDPAYWMPDQATIATYQKADLIVLNGANYARWVGKVSLPRAKTVNTSSKFKAEYISSAEVTTHSHGPGGKHAHESLAFTTWLDLDLAARQAGRIAAALGRKMPEKKAEFERNLAALSRDLGALDARLKAIVAKAPGTPLIGSHPVYDYLARRYGLKLRSVHWEPDETPTLEQWNNLTHLRKEHPARWMVWEGEPLPAVAQRLEKIGVKSVVFDPAGNVPAAGDFLTVMGRNIEHLEAAYR